MRATWSRQSWPIWRPILRRRATSKKLVGRPGYRLRVGDWRVIYELESGRLVVRVLEIGPRGGVYQ